MKRFACFFLLAGLVAAGCDSTEVQDDGPLTATRIDDLPADPSERDPATGQTNQTGRYTFFSLREGEVVLSYDDASRADSASTEWDLAFQGATIIANGGASGPGEGGLQVVADVFENVTEAPTSGYVDAISSTDWYTYDPSTHLVAPTPGRTIVVRTADGRYAKLRILSYYQGAPAAPAFTDPSRYYTFEYVFQEDGSRDLTSEEGA